jgi:stress-induced-phosphoprotein 1
MVYLNNMAAAYFGLKKFSECVDTCKKALEVGKENRADFKDVARAYARMGNALVKLDDLEGAVLQYEKSLMEHRDPHVELKSKDTQRLIDKRAAEAYLDPVKAEEQRLLGNEFFKAGKWVEAIKEYSEGLKRDPNNHLIYSNRGATYLKVMDMGSALRDCEKCIELKPDFPRAYARKATVEILCKQVHKAKETVELGLKLCPDDAELKEVQRKVQMQVYGVGLTPEEREQRAKEAMKDPKIVSIMQDPVMRTVLDDMQRDPSSAHKHMQDARVKANIETLMAAGIIQAG